MSSVAATHHEDVRKLGSETLKSLRERATELGGKRRRELLGASSRSRPFASKVHLSIQREKSIDLGMGEGGKVG